MSPCVGYLPPDPALPGRDWLLDDVAAAVALSTCVGTGGLSFDRVERRRVKYRVGEGLRTVHRVWSGSTSWLVASRLRASGAEQLFAASRDAARPCAPLRGIGIDPALQLVCWTYPNDRVLTALPLFDAGLPAVRDAFPGVPLTLAVAGCNPERAVTGRLLDAAGTTHGYAKCYAPGTSAPAAQVMRAVTDAVQVTGRPLRTPALLAEDREHDVLVVAPVTGAHLEQLSSDQLARAFGQLGEAVAHLHTLPVAPDRLTACETTSAGAIRAAAAAVAWVRPDLGMLAQRAADLLERHRPPAAAPVTLHGDLNARNWLFDGTTVGLIDLDQAASGPAAVDLASVLGWLRTRTLLGVWSESREAHLAHVLLRGYAEVRTLPTPAELLWHRAAALLVERAARAVTRVRPDVLHHLDGVLAAVCADAEAA